MDTRQKLDVLRRIAGELNRAHITWALGASMLLYFKGVTDTFHDIDLMVKTEDAEAARDILLGMGTLMPPNPEAKYRTKLFLEFVIEGVDVDVMAGFAIAQGDTVHDCSLRETDIAEMHDLDGEAVPLQSIARWREYYQWMGRTEKVRMIDAFLAQQR